ncbi:hypothetical protein [Streptomyces sp. NBC_01180]|uniref:hypothetical protein n=1 Tax=Streptomyces sp. NBC_01180 TaxID=2903763 RepID=UPI003869C3B2|nr:hypothetical protein OG708_08945 [Streptomyces sp. NBC_01180]
MSAREELFESLMPAYQSQYAPGEEESMNAMLDAYRAEVRREAAEEIVNHAFDCGYHEYHCPCDAAALIYPEVQA